MYYEEHEDICNECHAHGNNCSKDKNGEQISNCYGCPNNHYYCEYDDDWGYDDWS